METYVIYAENHDTKECPSIPGLKVVYQEEGLSNQVDSLYFITKIPWKNPQPNTTQGFNTQPFAQFSQNKWTSPMPFQSWPQPWSQGWKNPYGKFPQYPEYPQFPQF